MEINCTQCGAGIPIEEDSEFLKCPYCDTSLYVETDRTVKHYYITRNLGKDDLSPVIQRKLSYLEIKDKVEVSKSHMAYLPFWGLVTSGGKTIVIPASAPPLEDLDHVKIPAGDLKLYNDQLEQDNEVVQPKLLLEDAALEARNVLGDQKATYSSASLIHLPMFAVSYYCRGMRYRALVDAVSGEVYADDWPAAPQKQKDKVLGIIAAIAFFLFFVEAAVIPGFGWVILAYAVTGTAMYFLAWTTLRKMGW